MWHLSVKNLLSDVQWRFPEKTTSGWMPGQHMGVWYNREWWFVHAFPLLQRQTSSRVGGTCKVHTYRWTMESVTLQGCLWDWSSFLSSGPGPSPALISDFQTVNQGVHSVPTPLIYMGSVGEISIYNFRITWFQGIFFKEQLYITNICQLQS